MDKWVGYAIVSMLFAGCTSVIAKLGLAGISGELGLAVRTLGVFILITAFTAAIVPRSELQSLTLQNLGWLSLSALTTTLSWIFYYKAIKEGDVSTVVLIDKGSVVIALLLAYWVLRETLSPQKLLGAALIVAGLIVLARKP